MKHSKYILAVIAVSILVNPFQASANLLPALPTRTCNDLTDLSGRTISRISERLAEAQKNRLERLNAINKRWNEQDAEKVIAREGASRIKTQDFGPLERSLADASAEKKRALAAFKSALEKASRERQAAIDAANAKFRAGVKAIFAKRSEDINTATSELRNSIKTSIDGVAERCVGGLSLAEVQADAALKLRSLRQSFQADSRTGAAHTAELRKLTADYKAEIKAATESFRTKVATATAEFKAALAD